MCAPCVCACAVCVCACMWVCACGCGPWLMPWQWYINLQKMGKGVEGGGYAKFKSNCTHKSDSITILQFFPKSYQQYSPTYLPTHPLFQAKPVYRFGKDIEPGFHVGGDSLFSDDATKSYGTLFYFFTMFG